MGWIFTIFITEFSIIVTPPEAWWIFMAFTTDSQILSLRLRRSRLLWILLQILNYCHFARGRVDSYDFHQGFLIQSTLLKSDCINMAFTVENQLLLSRLRRNGFLAFIADSQLLSPCLR